jgi:hypothetical protein
LSLREGSKHSGRVAKLREASALHHLAVDEDDDAVNLAHRAQSMGNDDPRYIEVSK